MKKSFQSVIAFFTAILTFAGIIPSPYDTPVDNANGGDPFIVENETGCYYTFTTGSGIEIRRIAGFDDTTVLEKKTVYTKGKDGITGSIWAPEIHKAGDKWYIIACALFDKNTVSPGKMPEAEKFSEHSDYYRYCFVLESNTDDILGDYSFKGILSPDGMNNIDGTYLMKDDKLYFVCSAYLDVAHQCILITEMENPYTLKSDAESCILSRPEYYWETKGWRVNEGPSVLYHGDDIFIVYSASGYSSGYYSLGMLTLKGNTPENPDDWHKSRTRVQYRKSLRNIYNAGHCSFLYRNDGSIYMVYHATASKSFSDSPRLTYIKKVQFFFDRPFFA